MFVYFFFLRGRNIAKFTITKALVFVVLPAPRAAHLQSFVLNLPAVLSSSCCAVFLVER